jgi:lipid-binding SYLF domain-containing protein
MNGKRKTAIALLTFLTTAAWAGSSARDAGIARIQTANTILSQIMEAPDRGIPDSIMSGAKCIAIVPSMLKVSFIFGANYGKGVATCRTTSGWSAPTFFRVEGGSFGFQAGGQASDLVLIVRTDAGMQHLLQSKFKLGADASAAAGPVGRDAQAATDLTMRAQILTYSRSRGLFLGVSLAGAVVRQDDGDTQAFYGKDWTFYSLLNGQVPPPPDSENFLKTVEHYAPTQRAAVRPAPTPAPLPATQPAVTAAPAAMATPAADTTPVAAPPASTPTDPAAAPTPTDPAATTPTPDPAKTPSAAPTATPSTPTDPTGSGHSF